MTLCHHFQFPEFRVVLNSESSLYKELRAKLGLVAYECHYRGTTLEISAECGPELKNQIIAIEAYDEIRQKCSSFRYLCIMKTIKERNRRETV